MFVKLTTTPGTVEAERIPTMFGDEQIRINDRDYIVAEHRTDDGVAGVLLRHLDGSGEHAVTVAGEYGQCSCENFRFVAGREGRPCKHLSALIRLGYFTPTTEQVR